jgi:hypothetical protein
VSVGCFCAANVYNDGVVNWVTVEKERLIFACWEERYLGDTYGYMVYVCLYPSV